MSKIKVKPEVTITATIEFTENELNALDAMVGYGDDAFFKAFYIRIGKHYMKPFERDLRALFAKIRSDAIPALHEIREIRKQLENVNKGQS